jgi:CDP-6-deoxy-D-xylo-4-hexulose-3-dehydrase
MAVIAKEEIMELNWPLMHNNISRDDLDVLIEFLKGDPILTQSGNVQSFEREWSDWVGVRYSVFVNSGASANLLTISALKHAFGEGEIIVPTLTWVSDIAAVLHCGFRPVFVDINPKTLGMDIDQVIAKLTSDTKAVFLTHVLGFNALGDRLITKVKERNIALIEDVCESHGATFNGRKLGTFGLISNFSFYYAHHLTTIEGGMICTDDPELYQILRLLRSHGMVREAASEELKAAYQRDYPGLNPDFIFAYPAYNMRSTELNAVIGRNQLSRLDAQNRKRVRNFQLFLENLDPDKYRTDYDVGGSVNYALLLVLRKPDPYLCEQVIQVLRSAGVEFRRGTSGGGNQLRQPYLQGIIPPGEYQKYPETEHIHFYGFYIGNYPDLPPDKIYKLCDLLNGLRTLG